MFQINNYTPFTAELHPYEDLDGNGYAVIIIKGTFTPCHNSHQLAIADEQVPIQHADQFYAEPGKSSIKYGSDLAMVKQATDVVMIGTGYAPNGRAVEQFDVSLSIGDYTNTIRVFGDRHWQKGPLGWQITPPAKIEQMPLIYENAYGGIDLKVSDNSQPAESEPFNPIGKGFFPKKSKPIEGQPLPNLEDPHHLIHDLASKPKPVGFGVIARDWQPRVALAGTFDQTWEQERMPLLPLDFDMKYFNGAHPDLIVSPSIQGDELIQLHNATKTGYLAFQLPNKKFALTASIKNQPKDYIANLDTLVIEPDENRVMLTWRAAIPCKRDILYLDYVTIKEVS